MNAKLPSRILLSTLLYATLLATTMAIPLVLSPHDSIAFAGLVKDASASPMNINARAKSPVDATQTRDQGQVWDRYPGLDSKSGVATGQESVRAPHAEVPAAQQPDVRRPRIDRTGPDAEMIRTGKVKTKTLRV